MTSRALLAGNACAPVRARDFLRTCAMLKRFDAQIRPRVAALVATHAHFEDLMWSFPAVLHTLALARDGEARTENARVLVRNGAPLKLIAGAIGIPVWTRALQAEALAGPLPVLPDSKLFENRVANHIPKCAKKARLWLARVSAAYRDEYLTTVPGRNGNTSESTESTLNVDAAASYSLTDNMTFTFEALNLTDQESNQILSPDDRMSFYHTYGTSMFMGFRYTY